MEEDVNDHQSSSIDNHLMEIYKETYIEGLNIRKQNNYIVSFNVFF